MGHGGRHDHRIGIDLDGDDNDILTLADNNEWNASHDNFYAGTHKGNISIRAGVDGANALVNAGADFTLIGGNTGNFDRTYAQVGHGGWRTSAQDGSANNSVFDGQTLVGHNGSIDLISSGGV